MCICALAAVILLCATPVIGGEPPDHQVVDQAERLRNERNFPAAIQLLEPYVASHPEDTHAARMLAQTLYWLGDIPRAERAYQQALAIHPGDARTRLDFARMLAETRQTGRARAQLTPLASEIAVKAEVATLLGTLAYWEGDLTTARRSFSDALAVDPARGDARRQRDEIDFMTRPWLRIRSSFWHDDQPLDRAGVGLEAGWYLTPLAPLEVRIEPLHYRMGGPHTSTWSADVKVSHFEPRARLDTEIGGGLFRGPEDDSRTSWIGHAALGVRLPRRLRIRGRVERSPYLHTQASLETTIMVTTAIAQVRLDDPDGWLGQAEFRVGRYPDSNVVRAAHAWLFAPIVRRERLGLQAGYATAAADADQLRFVLAHPIQPYPPTDPLFNTDGVYDPYYTPRNQMSHSAIAALRVSTRAGATLRASGAYGFHATEDAPGFFLSADGLQRAEFERDMTPWRGRLDLDLPISRSVTLSLAGEAGRTTFYRWRTGGLDISYRFNRRMPSTSPSR